ncbi:MAG: dihydropteroate synthase [Clostridia bacterium]|nr:dihydropteroate synthase [Clostridia bacterium]
MIIGNKTFTGGTHVMAIINLTPDSFWAGSRAMADSALFAAEKAVEEGAEILDIGAQSTRPGYKEISAEEEIERFEKPVREIKKHFDIPVSVDTYFSLAARAALDGGADMINDVWGLTYDKDMAKVVAEYGASVCIMHNAKERLSGDIWAPILKFLQNSADLATDCGIDKNKICLDGGIGFAKDRQQNLELLQGYDRLAALGYPLLLGTSRKSLFGGDVNDRLKPTLQSTRLAVKKGIMFVRVHDVKENVQAIKEAEYECGQR